MADYVWWVVADYVWWNVADYVWWDVADYVSILKSNSATTNEAASYSRLGIDGSFRTIKIERKNLFLNGIKFTKIAEKWFFKNFDTTYKNQM